MKTMSFVKADFEAAQPSATIECETSDNWIQLFDQAWYQYTQADVDDVSWPFYLRVRRIRPEYMTPEEQAEGENLYVVGVVYCQSHLRKDKAEKIHEAMVRRFPELAGGRQNAKVRRVTKEDVPESKLVEELQLRYRLLSSALQGV